MRHSNGLLSPTQCLLRALCPIPQRPIISRHVLQERRAKLNVSARRPAQSFYVNRNSVAGVNGTGLRVAVQKKDALSDIIKDEEIDAPLGVQMVQGDGKLGPVQRLMSILHNINRGEEHLVQVSPPDERRPTAVVRIFKRADLIKQKLERKKAIQKQQKSVKDRAPKQMELNWAIGSHDLDIKLGQLENFLEKGKTVEIILAAKRKQRKATPEEGEEVLKKIRERLIKVDAREVKRMDGQVLKQATLTVRKKGVD
jgi:translation initiation factor IF-3